MAVEDLLKGSFMLRGVGSSAGCCAASCSSSSNSSRTSFGGERQIYGLAAIETNSAVSAYPRCTYTPIISSPLFKPQYCTGVWK